MKDKYNLDSKEWELVHQSENKLIDKLFEIYRTDPKLARVYFYSRGVNSFITSKDIIYNVSDTEFDLVTYQRRVGISKNNRIFTSEKRIDKLVFTNEERAKFNLLMADKVAEYAKDTLSESTIRSKTRRFISICIISTYLILVFALVVLSVFSIKNTIIQTLVLNSPLTTGFIMVLAFFFGGYYLQSWKKK